MQPDYRNSIQDTSRRSVAAKQPSSKPHRMVTANASRMAIEKLPLMSKRTPASHGEVNPAKPHAVKIMEKILEKLAAPNWRCTITGIADAMIP